MATVQNMVLRLALRVDPYIQGGGELGVWTITSSTGSNPVTVTAPNHGIKTDDTVLIAGHTTKTDINGTHSATYATVNTFTVPITTAQGNGSGGTATTICVSDGEKFLKQRLLDIYNDARVALFQAVVSSMADIDEVGRIIGAITKTGNLTMTLAGAILTGPYPSDYLRFIGTRDSASPAVPVILLPQDLHAEVVGQQNPHLTQSTLNKFIFEIGGTFRADNAPAGSWPATETLILDYYGLALFVLADVTGGTTNETYSKEFEPLILQIAQAIANAMGNAEAVALAKSILSMKGGS